MHTMLKCTYTASACSACVDRLFLEPSPPRSWRLRNQPLFARRYFTKQSLLWNKDYWPGAGPYEDIPDHVFDRPDVRLVLDIGAGNGNLAVNLFRRYGDRIITVSTTLIVAAETVPTLPPPFMQVIAARGFPTVALDIFSFFPFGESTFDVIHTSWVYTSGFTRHAIMEMYRVLRPGGYLIHTVWDKMASTRGTLLLESLAAKMNWKLLAHYETFSGRNVTQAKLRGDKVPYDTYKTIYQMPSYKYSKK